MNLSKYENVGVEIADLHFLIIKWNENKMKKKTGVGTYSKTLSFSF